MKKTCAALGVGWRELWCVVRLGLLLVGFLALLTPSSLVAVPLPGSADINIRTFNDAVLIPVLVHGRALNFLLDTGSEQSALAAPVVADLGLTPHATGQILKNFRQLSVDIVQLDSLRVFDREFRSQNFAVLDLGFQSRAIGEEVDGVLGNDILSLISFKLNYSKQKITVGALTELRPWGTFVSLAASGGQFYLTVRILGTSGKLLLDTGANSTDLSWQMWRTLSATWTPSATVEGVLRAGNPTSSAFLVCLPSLHLGAGLQTTNQVVRVQRPASAGSFAARPFQGILGSDVLRHFEVIFDLAHCRIFLRPDPEFQSDPERYITIGIQFAPNQAGNYTVMAVWKQSPAEMAGILPGDQIIAINGASAAKLTPQDVSRKLHASAGTALMLQLERDRSPVTFQVKTRRLLCDGPEIGAKVPVP